MTPIACNCSACRSMCEHSVCIPTPDEARALIRLDPRRMARYEFPAGSVVAPAIKGKSGTLLSTREGPCTFYGEHGCELHDKGLKPLEGRLARHDRPWLPIRMEVMKHWRGKRYESVAAQLERNT